MEHIDIYKGPTRGAFSLMTTDERIKIFKRIFSYFRSKEFRLVSKFFWSLYDNYSKDEDAKLDGVEGDIEKLYSSFKDSILDRTVNNKNYQTKLDQQLWRFKDNILALKKAIKENLGGMTSFKAINFNGELKLFQLQLK